MLPEFLLSYREEILAMTEKKALALAGVRPSSEQLKLGLPIFYTQLIEILLRQTSESTSQQMYELEIAAFDRQDDTPVKKSAGIHGAELLRLGYTLSHAVHSYGSLCQSITELATEKNVNITPAEFGTLNLCLDIAIASAVTEYQSIRNTQINTEEIEHLGFLAHELRNALGTVTLSVQMIRDGTVDFSGNTGQVLNKGLKRIEELINRSLTEVRLRVDPKVHVETFHLIQIINEIVIIAEVEARQKKQILEIHVDPTIVVQADTQLIYSALSNLIQNAIKYTHVGGQIQVRALLTKDGVSIEVEDECGGLANNGADLFKPFHQQHQNRKGLGLGLTIAQRAVELNHGTINVRNIPGKGCLFIITLPVLQPIFHA